MNKEKYKTTYKKIIRRFIVAFLLLLFIFFLKQYIIGNQIERELNTSYIINIAGRQRMLSQKIVKDISFIYRDKPTIKDEVYRKDLANSIKDFKES